MLIRYENNLSAQNMHFTFYPDKNQKRSELTKRFSGEPWGTRTSGPQLRRLLLYPAELMTLERVMGIEPTWSAWKAEVLPLNYTRIWHLI